MNHIIRSQTVTSPYNSLAWQYCQIEHISVTVRNQFPVKNYIRDFATIIQCLHALKLCPYNWRQKFLEAANYGQKTNCFFLTSSIQSCIPSWKSDRCCRIRRYWEFQQVGNRARAWCCRRRRGRWVKMTSPWRPRYQLARTRSPTPRCLYNNWCSNEHGVCPCLLYTSPSPRD